jgi:hypothetical protein
MTRSLFIKLAIPDNADDKAVESVLAFAIKAAADGALCRRPTQAEFTGFDPHSGVAQYEPIDGPELTATLHDDSWGSPYIVRDILDEAHRIIRSDYYDDVRSVADDLAEQWKSGEIGSRDDFLERLSEAVDGTQRVIYTGQAMDGLRASDNSGAYIEDFGAEGAIENGDIAWSRLMFAAMERDVTEQLEALGVDVNREPPQPTDECEGCTHERSLHNPTDVGCTASVGACSTCKHAADEHDADQGCLSRADGKPRPLGDVSFEFCECEAYVPSDDAGICDCAEFEEAN